MISNLKNTKNFNIVPKWFLRQAGRHIPEYYSIRNRHKDFIQFCLDEKSIIDATLLPLKYYNLDAVILFSDILIIPHFLGQNVTFAKGVGPLLQNIEINDTFFNKSINLCKLISIKNAITRIKKLITPSKDLIGFCGAPWTLSCYMIEGRSSKDFLKTRTFLWNNERRME